MTTTKTITTRMPINADQQRVFATVTDWSLQNKWIFATKVRSIGNDSHKVGSKLEAFTGYGTFGFIDTMIITKWDPPNLCEVTHTGNIVKGSGLFEVSKNNKLTYLTWTEHTEIPFGILGKIGWLFIGPITKVGLKISLRRFSKLF